MGLSNFDNIDEFITTNFCNFKLYKNELENIPGVRLSLYDDKEKYNYQYIILEIDKSITDITRDQLMKILWAENILVRRYFYPGCHRMEPYRSYFPNAGLLLQETERVSDQVLLLPTGMTITPEDIRLICHIIRFSLKQGCKLKFTI
jgi:dTDP-4-amino-4,6-dideoxygalactose transaminase